MRRQDRADCTMPDKLRHDFAVAALQAPVPPRLVQRWPGAASLRMTTIGADVSGAQEFGFPERMRDRAWKIVRSRLRFLAE